MANTSVALSTIFEHFGSLENLKLFKNNKEDLINELGDLKTLLEFGSSGFRKKSLELRKKFDSHFNAHVAVKHNTNEYLQTHEQYFGNENLAFETICLSTQEQDESHFENNHYALAMENKLKFLQSNKISFDEWLEYYKPSERIFEIQASNYKIKIKISLELENNKLIWNICSISYYEREYSPMLNYYRTKFMAYLKSEFKEEQEKEFLHSINKSFIFLPVLILYLNFNVEEETIIFGSTEKKKKLEFGLYHKSEIPSIILWENEIQICIFTLEENNLKGNIKLTEFNKHFTAVYSLSKINKEYIIKISHEICDNIKLLTFFLKKYPECVEKEIIFNAGNQNWISNKKFTSEIIFKRINEELQNEQICVLISKDIYFFFNKDRRFDFKSVVNGIFNNLIENGLNIKFAFKHFLLFQSIQKYSSKEKLIINVFMKANSEIIYKFKLENLYHRYKYKRLENKELKEKELRDKELREKELREKNLFQIKIANNFDYILIEDIKSTQSKEIETVTPNREWTKYLESLKSNKVINCEELLNFFNRIKYPSWYNFIEERNKVQ